MLDQIKLAITPKSALASPIQLIAFITNRCNARCGHCFNWRALNEGDDGLKPEDLQALSRGLGTLLTLSISGGEPFLQHDLPAAVSIFCANNGVRDITIPTNGLLPEHVYAKVGEMLRRDNRVQVAISLSLDGLEETQDEMRGVPGSFARLVETYRALVKLREEHPDHSPVIKIGTVLCNRNIRQIPDLIDWVKREMPAVDFHNFEIMRGQPRDLDIGPPTVADLEWVRPYIFRAWESYAFYGRRRRLHSWLALRLKRYIFQLYIETLREQRQLIPCYAGVTSLVIDTSANISFCELREPIGNLRQASLRDIWHSNAANQLRSSIARGECYCVHSCFQQKNVYLNTGLWPRILLYLVSGRFTIPGPSRSRLAHRPRKEETNRSAQ